MVFDSDKFDSAIEKIMLYLEEILAAFGLILLLIILVRLTLWLLQCNIKPSTSNTDNDPITNNHDGSNDPKHKSHKQNKFSTNHEKMNSDNDRPPTPVSKPESLKTLDDVDNDEIVPQYTVPEPGKPIFVIRSEESLPKPDVDPRSSQLSEIVVIEDLGPLDDEDSVPVSSMVIVNPSESSVHDSSEAEKQNNEVTVEISDQPQLTNKEEHTYAEVIRRKRDTSEQTETEDGHYETIDSVMVVTAPSQEQERSSPESTNQKDEMIVNMDDDEQNIPEKISVKKIPAHRCICPYCSNQDLPMKEKLPTESRSSTTTNSTNLDQRNSNSTIDGEEKEVLSELNETILQMERINEVLLPEDRVDDKEYHRNLELELERIINEVSAKNNEIGNINHQLSRIKTITGSKNGSPDLEEEEEEEEESSENPGATNLNDSSYYLRDSIIKIDPIYKYSTLIRNRMKVFEPFDNFGHDHLPSKNFKSLTNPRKKPDLVTTEASNRPPAIPPKPTRIDNCDTKSHLENNNDDDDDETEEVRENNFKKPLPQCAIYARVIDQIKKRQYLKT